MPTNRVRISSTDNIDFAETDKIFNEVATRQRSPDFYSALGYLPNPDPTLKRQGKDIQVYNDLLFDPTVAGAVARWKDGVQELEWDIDRGRAQNDLSEFVRRMLINLDASDESGGLNRIIGEILDARLYGFQPLEVLWAYQDKFIVPVDIVAKPHEWFGFNDAGQLVMRTQNNLAGEPVPDYKFICPRFSGSYKNPYGRAILSSCFWPVTFKKGGLKFFVQFAEKYGMPYIIGKHKFQSQDDVDGFLNDLDSMVTDGVMAIGMGSQEVDVVQTGSLANADIYSSLVGIMREEINHAILSHSSATSSTPGRLGNDTSALEASSAAVNAGKRLVSQAMNVLIKWTLEINGLTGEAPRFALYEEEDVDLATAERDEKLTTAGVRFTKEYYMRAYGFGERDFELTPAEPTGPPANFAEPSAREDQQTADEIADLLSAPETAGKLGQALVAPVLKVLEDVESYEEAAAKLVELFPSMNFAEIEAVLAPALKASMAMGRTYANER